MKTSRALLALLLLTTILISESACAHMRSNLRKKLWQQQMVPNEMIGIRIGNDFEYENYVAGAQLVLPAGLFWRFVPSFDYHFVDSDLEFDRWQFNGDLVFQPRPNRLFYFGGGLAVNYLLPQGGHNSTEYGANALFGIQSNPRRPMSLFVQARWSFFDETEFALLGGINMQLR